MSLDAQWRSPSRLQGRRSATLLLTAAALLLSSVAFANPGTAATTRPSRVTATMSPTTVAPGARAALSGVVSPAGSGRPVQLLSYSAGKWHLLSTTKAPSSGRFRFTLPTSRVGSVSYRATAVPTRTLRAATSPPRTLVVRRPPPPPLRGPYVVHGTDDTRVLATEVLGSHRSKVVGSKPAAVGYSGATTAPGGRFLLTETPSGDAVSNLVVQGAGMAPRQLASSTPGSTCLGWDALSPNGTYAVWGLGARTGNGMFSLCLDPQQLTVENVITGTKHVVNLSTSQRPGNLSESFTRDNKYLIARGSDDAGQPMTAAFDTATGARVSFSGMSDLGAYTATDLPAAAGSLVAKGPTSSASPSGLWLLKAGSSQPPTPWGSHALSQADSDRITASPDGTRVAWLRSVGGNLHVLVAPLSALGSPHDLGGLGYTVQGNAQFLNWVGDGLLSVYDNSGGGGDVRDARTGQILLNSPVPSGVWIN